MLTGKKIVLGVSGGIAAYKMANVASMLSKLHADIHVVMTENATHFITPETFEVLTGNHCYTDTFDRCMELHVPHIALGTQADAILIAPASADVVGKIANGIADDMLTTCVLPATCPVMLAPSMNVHMYENPIVQDNLQILEKYGFEVIDPASGYLACGDTGAGKMPEPEKLLAYILRTIAHEKDLDGKKVLVTAGPTQEKIDPVRFITNHSTGKMGYAIAENFMLRGAEVTLVTGPVAITPPPFVKVVPIVTAEEMAEAVKTCYREQDIIIKSAAVADYRPAHPAEEKVKKKDGGASIELERTEDILAFLGENKRSGQFICGFSMETEHMLENSQAKLAKKKVDMIVANNLRVAGAGFGTDTNVVTLITKDDCKELEIMSKAEVAEAIVTEIRDRMTSRCPKPV